MVQDPAITLVDITKRFNSGATALERISLAVQAREYFAIVGASGSGKTTLLRLINHLEQPTAGTVRIGGDDVRTLDPIGLRRGIGYVFQGIGLFPHMTVAENISITPRLVGWDEPRMSARVIEMLRLVRLDPSFRSRFPHELSGGERQRVGIARALAARPEIVLMDEPFAALDPLTRDALGDDYRALHDELGLTTVMITHDILEACRLADRVGVLRAGRVIAVGTPSALMTHEHPYVRELMQSPRRHVERLAFLLDTKEH